ncbi:MAG: hypothetical protein AB4290_20170 [Spirulina sp.]
MQLNQFSVRITPGRETREGYVELEHNTQYQLNLGNLRPTRCDAKVEIDGKHVGTWRIERYRTITLERPAHDTGKFTFYELDTPEAHKIGLTEGDPNLGLIKVTFTPEREITPVPPAPSSNFSREAQMWRSSASSSKGFAKKARKAGGTGLSGQSQQQFSNAQSIAYDLSQQTIINLRLVAIAKDEPRPLTPYSTPVPPPV